MQTLTPDIFQVIFRFIPYDKQGALRRTCKAFSQIVVFGSHSCELPDVREIVEYLFTDGVKPLLTLVYGYKLSIDIFSCERKGKGVVLSVRPANDGWWSVMYEEKHFETPNDLVRYLRGFDMMSTNKLKLDTSSMGWETLRNILCRRSHCQVCNSGAYLILLIRKWALVGNKMSTYNVSALKELLIGTSKLHDFELGKWNSVIDGGEIIECVRELDSSDFVRVMYADGSTVEK